jgi:Family of unknown function (DUF6326)
VSVNDTRFNSNLKFKKMNQANKLEDFKVNVKIKLSVLWTSVMFCYIYEDYFELYIPKKVEGIISGENFLASPIHLIAGALLLIIPALMICLSILLTPKISRLLNMIFGTLYTALMLWIASNYLIDKWLTFAVLFAMVESIITSIIVWYAWKWPRQSQYNQ